MLGGWSAELRRLAAEDVSMVALPAYEILLSWLFLHLLLIAIPAVAGFLVGRRGRLHLWHVAALVLLAALLLLPAVACVSLRSRPEAWLSVVRMHASGRPEFSRDGDARKRLARNAGGPVARVRPGCRAVTVGSAGPPPETGVRKCTELAVGLCPRTCNACFMNGPGVHRRLGLSRNEDRRIMAEPW